MARELLALLVLSWAGNGPPAYDPGMDIRCGDALGISCGTWIALLNGAVGAFVSAVLGGLVALLVVRLTNAHQRRVAERSAEIAAIADFISALEEAWQVVKQNEGASFDHSKYQLLMRTAVIKLGMSGDEGRSVGKLMTFWPYLLTDLLRCYWSARRSEESYAPEIYVLLNESIGFIFTWLPSCTDPKLRNAALESLKGVGNDLDASVELLDGLWVAPGTEPVLPWFLYERGGEKLNRMGRWLQDFLYRIGR